MLASRNTPAFVLKHKLADLLTDHGLDQILYALAELHHEEANNVLHEEVSSPSGYADKTSWADSLTDRARILEAARNDVNERT